MRAGGTQTTKFLSFGIILCLLGIIAISGLACNSNKSEALPSQTATTKRGDLRIEITASGNVAMATTADLAFDVEGTVEKVLVEEGDLITTGQILAQLERFGLQVNYRPTNRSGSRSTTSRTVVPWENKEQDLEFAVLQAKANLNTALINLKNAKSPQGTNTVPDPRNVENKKHSVQLAEAALGDAEEELGRFLQTSPEIIAPLDGFVTNVNVQGGDIVTKGTVAVSIAASDKFETTILVSEKDIRQIKVGMPATVQVTAMNGALFPAKVATISPTATVQNNVVNYQVGIDLLPPQNLGSAIPTPSTATGATPATTMHSVPEQPSTDESQISQLRDGFTATVKILIIENKDVVLVPNRAIISEGRTNFVDVVKEDSTERRQVMLGLSNGQFTEITKGLTEGEMVLIQQIKNTSQSTPSQLPREFRRMLPH
ncbi:efflux RND transporter periplasmic adaptor subunit [Chloroflexota bacterium]